MQPQKQGCGVGVGVPRSPYFGPESFEADSDSGPYLFHLDLCVILLQTIWLLCNLFYN